MKAFCENHYLGDRDVANRPSFFCQAGRTVQPEANHGLIRFLARHEKRRLGISDRQKMLLPASRPREANELARYLRKIPEHWVPLIHPISLRMQAPVPIRTQCFKHKIGFVRGIVATSPAVLSSSYRIASVPKPRTSSRAMPGIHPRNEEWMGKYVEAAEKSIETYLAAIEDGVCPEQARFF